MVSVLLMTIGLVSCSQSSDYRSVIPAEPVMVVKANVDNLLAESELLQDNQITGLIKNDINEMPENSRELLRKILADPANSGLDLKQPAYVVIDNIEQTRGFALFAVKDKEKVTELLNAMEIEDLSMEEKSEYSLLKTGNANIVAFDETKLVAAFSQGACDVTEYMSADTEAKKSKSLAEFMECDDDVAYYMAFKDVLRLAEGTNPEAFSMLDTEKAKDAKLVMSLNFEAGKAVLDTRLEDADELLEISRDYMSSPNSGLQVFIPKTCYGFMQFGIKDLGSNIEKSIPEAQRAEFDEYMAMANKEAKKMGIKEELTLSLLNSLDGGMIFGIAEKDNSSPLPIPQMILVAECKDNSLFNLIAKSLESNRIATKTDGNTYSLMGLYTLGFADGKLFVMPQNLSAQCYKDGTMKSLAENLTDNDMAQMVGEENGMIIDTKATAKGLEDMGVARRAKDRAILELMNKFTYAGYSVKEDCKVEYTVYFEDYATNSLKQIKDMAVNAAIGNAAK